MLFLWGKGIKYWEIIDWNFLEVGEKILKFLGKILNRPHFLNFLGFCLILLALFTYCLCLMMNCTSILNILRLLFGFVWKLICFPWIWGRVGFFLCILITFRLFAGKYFLSYWLNRRRFHRKLEIWLFRIAFQNVCLGRYRRSLLLSW